MQTGIRRSELANLLVTDVELPAKFPRGERVIGVLHVRSGKGRRERTTRSTTRHTVSLRYHHRLRHRAAPKLPPNDRSHRRNAAAIHG